MARENSGSLRRNDKAGVETRPDYKGSINIGGEEFWLSGWLKEAEDGSKWMSLSAQPKDAPKPAAKPTTKPGKDFDDDIPFLSRDHGRGDFW